MIIAANNNISKNNVNGVMIAQNDYQINNANLPTKDFLGNKRKVEQ